MPRAAPPLVAFLALLSVQLLLSACTGRDTGSIDLAEPSSAPSASIAPPPLPPPMPPASCKTDLDCAADPDRSRCAISKASCVQCLTDEDCDRDRRCTAELTCAP
jgi:hypothetical protein